LKRYSKETRDIRTVSCTGRWRFVKRRRPQRVFSYTCQRLICKNLKAYQNTTIDHYLIQLWMDLGWLAILSYAPRSFLFQPSVFPNGISLLYSHIIFQLVEID
jgi:hypothetical protein